MKPQQLFNFFILSILTFFLIFKSLFAQPIKSTKPLSSRIANYKIKVDLNTETKILNGQELLIWKNTSADTINELQFHLYLNAFKNSESTFIRESNGRIRGVSTKNIKKNEWGWNKILSMLDENNNELIRNIKFIHPDDTNTNDQTVIKVSLVNPVLPDSIINLKIKFKAKLPKIIARSGYSRNYFLVGQWFPKIGVYEIPGQRYATEGSWNCHQYHANSEFYADFGNYDIEITLPKNYVVGATGMLKNSQLNTDGTKTLKYIAEDVVDFAWTASPKFEVVEDKWKHVYIRVLMQPEHLNQSERYISSLKNALEYFNQNLGEYPYTTITLVDPPFHAIGSSGMEYPTFFTAITLWNIPSSIKIPEQVTVHEFGHNYFMGLLASNEFEEAWLDEGFNSYFESRIMDYYYGKKYSFYNLFGFHAGDFETMRNGYVGMNNPKIAPNSIFSWQYKNNSYGKITYSKTATWMVTLERLVGLKTMNEIMKTYFEKWKFKHPSGKNFIEVANDVYRMQPNKKLGDDLNWFFDQVIYGTDICDYKLRRIKITEVENAYGIFNDSLFVNNDDSLNGKVTKKKYKSSVFVERLGGIKMPVEVLVHFSNGTEEIETWNGKDRMKIFEYERTSKAVWAKVDPFNKLAMDVNLKNNSLNTKPRTSVVWKYTSKVLFWLENIMLSLSMMF